MNLAEKYKEMLEDQGEEERERQLQEMETEIWAKAGCADLSLVQVVETEEFFDRHFFAFAISKGFASAYDEERENAEARNKVLATLSKQGWEWIQGEESSMLFFNGEPKASVGSSCRGAIVLFAYVFSLDKNYKAFGKVIPDPELKAGWDFAGGWLEV